MSCRDNLDSKPTPSQFSEEFKAKVLKRGLELRNWSAVCKEFNIPRRTLSNWRHNYTNLLEQLAFEMGVNVYYNPQIDMEYQSNKPGRLRNIPYKDTRINLILSTRILTPLESAALVLRKAKVPMTTQRIYQDILLYQLRKRIDFDDLKSDLLSHCGPEDPFTLMKSTTAFFDDNIYAFRLKQNSSTKKLLTSGYSCLKEDIKPSFLPAAISSQDSDRQEESDPSVSNAKGLNLLVPNLCVKPISVAAGGDKRTSPGPVSVNCHQIYIRENSFPIVSPSICKETAPSPVKYLLASDRRRGKVEVIKHRGVCGEEFPPPLDLVNDEEQTDVGESMVVSVPMTSGTSSMIIERQSDSLNLNTPCVLLTHNNDTGQLYHVATHPDQPADSHMCVPSSCTERAEMPTMVSELGSSTVGIAPTDTAQRHVVCDVQAIKRETQKKPATRGRKKKNGIVSPVSHFLMDKDVKTIINKKNFSFYFSKEERTELVSLLPELDQVVTPSEVDLSETTFSNEYFSQALTEWHDDVLCGGVNPNSQHKYEKTDTLKKSDLWKVKQLRDYEKEEKQKSNRPGVVTVNQLRLEMEQEKRSLSKSLDETTLSNLFLHPSMLHTSVTQLETCQPTQPEIRIPLTSSLLPVLSLKLRTPSDVIDLTLSDSDDSNLQTDDVLFNKSSLVISLPRIQTDLHKESPSKRPHRANNSTQPAVQPHSSKRLKTSHKQKGNL